MVEMRPTCADVSGPDGGRLNLLLTYGGWRSDSWADQLPRLLEPMGVRVLRAGSGREATEVIRRRPVHIAVVDLMLPLDSRALDGGEDGPSGEEGGPRLLELLSRLEQSPPTVVVRRRRNRREDDRCLASALEAGVFAVVDRPVRIETVLEVMRRALRRYYADRWPGGVPGGGAA